jgi:hypothetical protein
MTLPTALNVGCGPDVMVDAVNVDVVRYPQMGEHDVVGDVRTVLLSGVFPKDHFTNVYLYHVLEHIPNWEQVLRDLHPYCADGCVLHIRVPYYNSPGNYNSLDHCRFFNWKPFRSFVEDENGRSDRTMWFHKETVLLPSRVGWLVPPIRLFAKDNITLRVALSWYIGNVIREVRGEIIVVKLGCLQ